MRENRTYGSEGGEPGNRASLPLSLQHAEQIAGGPSAEFSGCLRQASGIWKPK